MRILEYDEEVYIAKVVLGVVRNSNHGVSPWRAKYHHLHPCTTDGAMDMRYILRHE